TAAQKRKTNVNTTTMNSIYKINKAINKPIEFKSLKPQYSGYLGIGVLLLLLVFAGLYISGVNMSLSLGSTPILGTLLFMGIYRPSDTYGQHGLIKRLARRNSPEYIVCKSRTMFTTLSDSSVKHKS